MELTLDLIEKVKPQSILGIIDPLVFGDELDSTNHAYIKSGICYEYYYAISKILKPKSIFEIGNRFGYSGIALLKGSPESEFYGWDLEKGTWGGAKSSREKALENFKISGFEDKVFLKTVNSQEIAVAPISNLIHIDGDHSYGGTYHDLEISKKSCRHLIIDDYDVDNGIDRVGAAVDEFIKNNEKIIKQVLHIPTYRGMIYIQFIL